MLDLGSKPCRPVVLWNSSLPRNRNLLGGLIELLSLEGFVVKVFDFFIVDDSFAGCLLSVGENTRSLGGL